MSNVMKRANHCRRIRKVRMSLRKSRQSQVSCMLVAIIIERQEEGIKVAEPASSNMLTLAKMGARLPPQIRTSNCNSNEGLAPQQQRL